jgi:hypothetical protein
MISLAAVVTIVSPWHEKPAFLSGRARFIKAAIFSRALLHFSLMLMLMLWHQEVVGLTNAGDFFRRP